MRHLSVQNTLKADRRGIAHPGEKTRASRQGEQELSLQKPIPTKTFTFLCSVGTSSTSRVCEFSPPAVTGSLCTHGRRRFLLERQRREISRARISKSPLASCSSLTG